MIWRFSRLCRVSVLASLLLSGCGSLQLWTLPGPHEPGVEVGDPAQSFWREQVQYPYPVHYAVAADARGHDWQIAYLDEYQGADRVESAPTLVLIPGRGANIGYFSQLMGYSLAAGLRVIAIDPPNVGKSIPGNLANPVTLPLDDSRTLIHQILVQQLGVSKAVYLGHSLGGQWVIGYALRYADAVQKLILESSYGLEEYPSGVVQADGHKLPLFDPAYRYDFARWRSIWAPLEVRSDEFARSAQDIHRNYWGDPTISHAPSGVSAGDDIQQQPSSAIGSACFRQPSVDGRFLTAVRVAMAGGNLAEYERYIDATSWAIYAQGIEVRRDDPKSLFKRLGEIGQPVFLAFGAQDAYLPTQALSGQKDLLHDLVPAAYQQFRRQGHAATLVVYAASGHVPHADVAQQFAEDVIGFVRRGKVKTTPALSDSD